MKAELRENEAFYKDKFPEVDPTITSEKFDYPSLSELETKYGCTALASMLGLKVFVLKLDSNEMIEIEGRHFEKRTSPIYIGYNENGVAVSLVFSKEDLSKYHAVPNLTSSMLRHDNLGRLHLHTPHTGPSSLFIRAQKFDSTSIATHVNDIINMLSADNIRGKKTILFIMSDNDPDFNPVSLLNSFFLYRMFKLLKLDFLDVYSYAARYSAYNCVEHLWAMMSNMLSAVILSPVVPGDSKPPAMQTKLSPDAIKDKEKVVFDNAMAKIEEAYWKDACFDGFNVDISIHPMWRSIH